MQEMITRSSGDQTLATRRFDRRGLLRVIAGTAGAAAIGSLLAACGGSAPSSAPAATTAPAAAAAPTAVPKTAPAATTAPAAAAATTAPAAAKPAAAAATGKLEMFSWWTTGGEEAGLKAMYDIYKKGRPNVDIINQAVAGGSGAGGNAKAVLKNRMLGGDPPDAFQVHMGHELLDGYVAANQVEAIDDLYASQGWEKAFPQGVLDIVKGGGHYWSVPVNIHRSNVTWYNKKVFAANNIKPPETFDEFFSAADKLKAAGVTPLVLGDNNPFASAHIFENVLLGTLGPDAYKGLWTGATKWEDAKVTTALETLKKMLSYVNSDHAAMAWTDANDLLIAGKGAMMIMGDWTNGDYTDKKFADYGWLQAPGTKGMFMALSDTFALPKGAKGRDNAIEWLKLAGSVEGQDAFNPLKGSIPANVNAGKASGYNEYLKSTMVDWKSHTIVPSVVHGAAAKDGWSQAFVDAINDFVAKQNVQATQKTLGGACLDANVCK